MAKIENDELNKVFLILPENSIKRNREKHSNILGRKGQTSYTTLPHAVINSAKQENIKRFIATTKNLTVYVS